MNESTLALALALALPLHLHLHPTRPTICSRRHHDTARALRNYLSCHPFLFLL